MFSKLGSREVSLDNERKDSPGSAAPSQQQVQPPRQEVAKPKPSVSVIGRTLEMKGELTAGEDLLIQGQVEGSVQAKARNLTVGANGKVKADIDGRNVTVQGSVRGNIRGKESVVIESSARVEGNIHASSIGVEKGARFKGSIETYGDSKAVDDGRVSEEVVDKILEAGSPPPT